MSPHLPQQRTHERPSAERPRGPGWLLAASLVVALSWISMAACVDQDAPAVGATGEETPVSETLGSTATARDGAGHVSLTVYLTRADGEERSLVPVERSISPEGSLARAALEAMLRGPTGEEAAQGYSTAIPPAATVLEVVHNEGVVTVDLAAGSFPASESPDAAFAWGQISRTMRQFPGVESVRVQVEGTVVP